MQLDEVLLSMPVAKDTYATITAGEFELICQDIRKDEALVADFEDFRKRWIEVNESDDDLGFADLPDGMGKLYGIVKERARSPGAVNLSTDILLRFLGLR